MFENLKITTERLEIRNYTMGDLDALHAITQQPEVMRFLPEAVMTREEVGRTLRWIIESYAVNRPTKIRKLSTAVTLKESGGLIGWVGLGPIDFAPETIELYYGFDRRHWGRGYATEAAAAMLRHGFACIGLTQIAGLVHPDNIASRRVLEKIGMRFARQVTGLPREHRFFEGLQLLTAHRNEWATSTVNERELTIRLLPHSDLVRLAEIDRSEHVTRTYEYRDGQLIDRPVDWPVSNWSPDPDSEHSAAALVRRFAPVLAAGGELLGAFADRQLVGLAVLRYELTPGTAQLALLHVTCGHRRRGAARRLTAEMMRLARGRGAREIYVSATPSESAVGFYLSQGFRPTRKVHPELFALEPEDIHLTRAL